jgi:Arc/MetJ-type ribon-helix-helix transcriptional regulator
VSANALAVAALHAGLPGAAEDARAAIVDERVSRAGQRAPRIERNLRLPEQLRARIDELTSASRARLPRATRADLVNAALRRGLPGDAERAAHLAADHAQRLERAAAA